MTYLNETQAKMERIKLACQKVIDGIGELLNETSGLSPGEPQEELSKLLTKRQREIFNLIGEDISVAEIAKRLSLKARTVESHRNTMRMQFKFKTVQELIEFAKTRQKEKAA